LRASDPATVKMTAYMEDLRTDPVKRAETTSVGVQIESLLRQTQETWQAIWTEVNWSRTGERTGTQKYRALVTVYSEPAASTTTEDEIRANPLGIYVRDFSWSEIVEAPAQPLRPITEGNGR
jgi:type IV secretion system protein VirB5